MSHISNAACITQIPNRKNEINVSPYGRVVLSAVSRIAYCIIVHQNPQQVSRLIHRIYSAEDRYYIHVFPSKGSPSFDSWRQIGEEYEGNVAVVQSKDRAPRSRFGLVQARLDGMAHFRESPYDYFITLSGQCYPLKVSQKIKEELGVGNRAFMEYFKLPYEGWWKGGLNRIHNRWFWIGNSVFRVPRLMKRLPQNLQPYGGSAWFCLPRKVVDLVLQFVSEEPRIVSFYRHSHIPVEMFFQTIVMNSPLKDYVVNEDKWYIDWSRERDGHPPILTVADIPTLMASGKLFARKFDLTVDTAVLDFID